MGGFERPSTGTGTAEQAWALMAVFVLDVVQPHFDAAVAEFDLASTQAFALMELARSSPIPMRELARLLRCDPSNVTGVTDRLEARGLVERRSEPRDRRVRTLCRTGSRGLRAVFAGRDRAEVMALAVWARSNR